MRNWLFCVTVSITFFYGCQNETRVSPSDPTFSAEAFYGIGTHSSATISWLVTDSYITHVDLYRSTEPEFSAATAVHLGSRHATIDPVYRDTALTDGVSYYYTIIPFHDNGDGTTDHSTNIKTITIIPRDVSALTGEQILYTEHIQPLFTNGCAVGGCHAAGVGGEDHSVAGSLHGGSRYSLASWSDAVNGTDDVAQIVPFRASKSHLIRHLNIDTTVGPVSQPSMPPEFSFPAELRDLLIRWIDHGARYDDGSIAFSAMPERGWGYVTNQGEDLTAVIDLDRNRIARYIVEERSRRPCKDMDGCLSPCGNVLGTYIHGLFHNEGLRRSLLSELARRKGVAFCASAKVLSKEEQYDRLADLVRNSLDMESIYRMIGLG